MISDDNSGWSDVTICKLCRLNSFVFYISSAADFIHCMDCQQIPDAAENCHAVRPCGPGKVCDRHFITFSRHRLLPEPIVDLAVVAMVAKIK